MWTSDGTPGGTNMVKDVFPGTGSGAGSDAIVYNGKYYFAGSSSLNEGIELYETDGTANGTKLFKDFYLHLLIAASLRG